MMTTWMIIFSKASPLLTSSAVGKRPTFCKAVNTHSCISLTLLDLNGNQFDTYAGHKEIKGWLYV